MQREDWRLLISRRGVDLATRSPRRGQPHGVQRGLADAGIASHPHSTALASPDLTRKLLKQLDLIRPANEHRACARHDWLRSLQQGVPQSHAPGYHHALIYGRIRP